MCVCPICNKKRELYPLFIANNETEYFTCEECKQHFFDMVMGGHNEIQKGYEYIKLRLKNIKSIHFKNQLTNFIALIENFL